jgi:hypothetical protein
MSDKRDVTNLPDLADRPAFRSQVSKDIEAQAGAAYTRDFWLSMVRTPVGLLSRRSLAFLAIGIVALLALYGFLIWNRLTAIPAPQALPMGDANTVMTHVYANFSGSKDGRFELFFPPSSDLWLFLDAYMFSWRDSNGTPQQVVIASYGNPLQLQTDYYAYTRTINFDRRQEAVAALRELEVENRGSSAYGGLWRGFYVGNILLLMSPSTPDSAQQELISHVLSIMGANQRDVIPSPTPF